MMTRKDEGDVLGWGSRTRMEGVGEEAVPSTACSAVPAASGDGFPWRRERGRKWRREGKVGADRSEEGG